MTFSLMFANIFLFLNLMFVNMTMVYTYMFVNNIFGYYVKKHLGIFV